MSKHDNMRANGIGHPLASTPTVWHLVAMAVFVLVSTRAMAGDTVRANYSATTAHKITVRVIRKAPTTPDCIIDGVDRCPIQQQCLFTPYAPGCPLDCNGDAPGPDCPVENPAGYKSHDKLEATKEGDK